MPASSEFELIARLAPFLAPSGGDVVHSGGDDAAVLRLQGDVCVTTDVLVEGVHFTRMLSAPADVGWKAIAVNVSDLAAMGARPAAAVVGLVRPASWTPEDVEALYRGMSEACARWEVALVGGDTVAGPALTVSVTAVGTLARDTAILRGGAQAGDHLVVVGQLGAAGAALAQHRASVPVDRALLEAHRRPRALPAAGAVLAQHATALIDVSDGLGADVAHLCRASEVRAVIDAARLPVPAAVGSWAAAAGTSLHELVCGGGEDFALVAAVPPETAGDVAAAAAAAEGVPAAVVGELHEAGEGPLVALRVGDGTLVDVSRLGYDHHDPARR